MRPKVARSFLQVICAFFLLGETALLYPQAAPQDDRVPVIVRFRERPGPGDQALLGALGGRVHRSYRSVPALAARLSQRAIDALSKSPAIVSIDPDVTIYAMDEYSDTWGVDRIGAKAAHAVSKGAGVNVCVIDSGIQTNHPELALNYKGGYDFVNDDADPTDDNGHGTHVAGTIGALLNNYAVVGAAPQVNLYAFKVLGANGSGSFSDVIAALEACEDVGGNITNNSYGSSSNPGTSVQQAFDSTSAAGILHVAAAGNSGNSSGSGNNVIYPARYNSVIAVAATDSSNNRASFSSTGSTVELAAPGVSIPSTYLNSGYAYASGTSMASPHVAGAAALVAAACNFSAGEIRTQLQQTALDLGSAGRDTKYGFGLTRADLAVNCSGGPAEPPSPPAAPSNLRVTGVGRNNISLAWNDNSDNETSFELRRCWSVFCTMITRPAGSTSYNDTGLSRRTTYTYQVRAVNSAGPSAYSNTVSQRTQ